VFFFPEQNAVLYFEDYWTKSPRLKKEQIVKMEPRDFAFECQRVPLLAQYQLRREAKVLDETLSMCCALLDTFGSMERMLAREKVRGAALLNELAGNLRTQQCEAVRVRTGI